MSFFIYDFSFLIVFCLAIAAFLIVKRKNVVREGLLFLYKTSIGLKLIDYIGKKYPKTLKVLSYISVACGYVLMFLSVYFLIQIVKMFLQPEVVKMVKVPPIMPLIPYMDKIFNVSWLPPFYFTYWIVAIALVAIFHEGFHGIFARFWKVKIKSTGFGILGPFLAFFVEQDEKQMKKAKVFPQLSILSAGVFANILLSIIFFILMIGFFQVSYAPSGALFSDYSYAVVPASILLNNVNTTFLDEKLSVEGINFTKIIIDKEYYYISDKFFEIKNNLSENDSIKVYNNYPAIKNQLRGAITEINSIKIKQSEDISKVLLYSKPGDSVKVTTEDLVNNSVQILNYEFKLGADYSNSSRPVLGVGSMQLSVTGSTFKVFLYNLFNSFKDINTYYKPVINPELTIFLYNLLWWIFMINISVAIANMIPLGIFDGGRFFYLTILGITKKQKIAEWAFKLMTWFLLAIVTIMMVLYFRGIF